MDWLIENGATLLAIGFVIACVIVARIYLRQLKRRKDRPVDFRKIVEQNGFSFLGDGSEFVEIIKTHLRSSFIVNLDERPNGFLEKLEFKLTGEYPSKFEYTCSNVAHLSLESGNCFVYDFCRTTRVKDRRAGSIPTLKAYQTVMFGHFENAGFPRCLICPRTKGQHLVKAFSNKVPEISCDKQLSNYRLIGHEEKRTLEYLEPKLVAALTQRKDLRVEFWENNFLISLDPRSEKSFKISSDFSDGRIGIDDIGVLNEFVKHGFEIMNAVDQSITSKTTSSPVSDSIAQD